MWIVVAVVGYFFFSVTGLVDKLILSEVKRPRAYAAVVGILGLTGVLLAIFGFEWPRPELLFLCLIAGALYIIGLVPFYKAIQLGQPSRVISFFGGLLPVFVLIMSVSSGIEFLRPLQYLAFFIIMIGGYLITVESRRKKSPYSAYAWSGLAALLIAGFYFLSKYIFLQTDFLSGFVLMRIGGLGGSLILLFYPGTFHEIYADLKAQKSKQTQRTGGLVLISQISAALAFILINYAVSIGKVSLVNALTGTQFVFLLLLASFFSKRYPQLKESIDKKNIFQKISAIVLIAIGLAILVL
ncbi:MAG: hypothetical protein ACOZBH_05195 [Patescibacteria group bacterium]